MLDVFLQAIANKVLELAFSPGGAGLATLGMGTAGGLSAKPELTHIITLAPRKHHGWPRGRSRTGA